MTDRQPPADDFPQPRRWNARWIWADDAKPQPNVTHYFRREFTPDASGEVRRLFVTADSRYRLYVNGAFVGEGPPPSAPHFYYYDEYDLGAALAAGPNVIAVVVHFAGDGLSGRGGLLAELVDAAGETLVATGDDWRAARAEAWWDGGFACHMNAFDPYQEFYDARKAPAGWDRVGFDDTAWPRATVLAGRFSDRPPSVHPWTYLVPRDIPAMALSERLPASVERVEECLAIANRMRPEDLSIGLSQAGRPLQWSRVEDAEHLCGGGAAVVQCSTEHMADHTFDGVYDPCIVLDFGRVITAYVELDLEGPAGGTVDIGLAERLIDGHFNNAIEGQFAHRYVMTDGRQTWRTWAWRGFRYAKLRFRDCFEPVRVHAARAVVTTYPFEERGSFASSDAGLGRVFDICRYTLRLCSNSSIMDTPWREQAQWLGDVSAVTLGGIYACFGDVRLAGKFLRQSAANQFTSGLLANVTNRASRGGPGTIPDYSLWWVIGLWQHYLYTGEARWVRRFYPHAVKVIRAFLDHVDERGLVADVPGWIFIDWADVDRRGECAPLNAIFYGALEALGRMARVQDDSATVRLVETVRAGIAAAFRERFFDEARGCFVDANVGGTFSEKVSEHAGAAAIRFGLCDDATAAEVAARLWERREVACTETQPFFTSVVLEALARIRRMDLALEIIRDRWGRRMVQRGATSTWEEWGINGSWRSGTYHGFLRALSHAWSAHPAGFLIRALPGIEILQPGCRAVRIRPHDVPMDYSVTFPTPLGPIQVTKTGDRIERSVPDGVEIVE